MNEEYIIRKAVFGDIPFLSKTVMEAEKSGTDKFSFSTLFNINHDKALENIGLMFEEEIDYCELSISSFLIVEHNNKPIAAFGGWIETFDGNKQSGILKSNLISYIFDIESILFLKTKIEIIKEILIEREPNTFQFEYLYVTPEYRGKNLATLLIKKHLKNLKTYFPLIKKAQVQVFINNHSAIKTYKKNGFEIVKTCKANNVEILQYLPGNEKCLMEIKL